MLWLTSDACVESEEKDDGEMSQPPAIFDIV